MTAEQRATAQQMQRYLEALGVTTAIDFEQERLYVIAVEVKYPALLNTVLKETGRAHVG